MVSTLGLGPTRRKQQWFFRSTTGRGWHKYDVESNKAIEGAIGTGKLCCDIPISGRIYTVDTVNLVQVRSKPYFKIIERIKRCFSLTSTILRKGIVIHISTKCNDLDYVLVSSNLLQTLIVILMTWHHQTCFPILCERENIQMI